MNPAVFTPSDLQRTSIPGRVTTELVIPDLEFCCPNCGAFIAALQPPTHKVEHNVTFYLKFQCHKCRRRSRRRVIIEAGPGQ